MTNKKIKKMISTYLDGELSNLEETVLKIHISKCQECYQEYFGFKQVHTMLKKVKLKEPKKDVWNQYWEKVHKEIKLEY